MFNKKGDTYIGIDLSLASTAFFIDQPNNFDYYYVINHKQKNILPEQIVLQPRVKTNLYLNEFNRLNVYRKFIIEMLQKYGKSNIEVIAIEGLALHAPGSRKYATAFLNYFLSFFLYSNDINVIIIPPTVVKSYITGNGNSSKKEVLTGVKKMRPDIQVSLPHQYMKKRIYDVYDAAALCIMAKDYGESRCKATFIKRNKIIALDTSLNK